MDIAVAESATSPELLDGIAGTEYQVAAPHSPTEANTVFTATVLARPRTRWIDAARGLAITLVVYHHVCMGLWTAGLPFWPMPESLAGGFLKVVRLPLLLFCSGFLVERSLSAGFLTFVRKKLIRLGVPYLVWSAVQFALIKLFADVANSGQWVPASIWEVLVQPFGPLWFLASLLVAQVVYGALRMIAFPPMMILLAVFTVRTCGWTEPVLSLNEWRVVDSILFVALGAAACELTFGGGSVFHRSLANQRRAFATSIVAAALVSCLILAFPPASYPWSTFFLSLIGIALGLGLVVLVRPTWAGSLLIFLGRHTLEILVMHTFATAGMRIGLMYLGIRQPLVHLAVGMMAGVLAPLALGMLLREARLGFVLGYRRQGPVPAPTAV